MAAKFKTAPARDAMRWFDDSVADVPRHALREVGFRRGATGEGRIFVEISEPTAPIEVRRQGNTLIVDFLNAQLPPQLLRRLDVQDFGILYAPEPRISAASRISRPPSSSTAADYGFTRLPAEISDEPISYPLVKLPNATPPPPSPWRTSQRGNRAT